MNPSEVLRRAKEHRGHRVAWVLTLYQRDTGASFYEGWCSTCGVRALKPANDRAIALAESEEAQ